MKRTVTEIPLTELWIDKWQIDAKRTSHLTRSDIKNILEVQPVAFVVANTGEPLKWVKLSECYSFWNNEADRHLIDHPNKINLEDLAGNYAYIASKWTGKNHDSIILLEKVHLYQNITNNITYMQQCLD